jgi:hypothetical protein
MRALKLTLISVLLLLLPSCLSGLIYTVAADGSVVVSTDGSRAVALGSGDGVVQVRIQDTVVSVPYSVQAGHVWLYSDGRFSSQPLSEPLPDWALALLPADVREAVSSLAE